ncbi:MAG: DUF4340 domain-containing protein [Clostridia bacterium]|nr:DUF4340 domain-containing protein [Clostridia bacterium]
MENKEYSIFSAPSEHNDKNTEAKKTRKKAITLISGVVLALLIFLSAFLIVKFMPEQKSEEKPNEFEPFKIIETSSADFTKITVENNEGKIELYSEEKTEKDEDGEETTKTEWYIKGYDKKDVSSEISQILSTVSNIEAVREITGKSAEECGFNEPRYKAAIETKDNKGYTILIGNDSPDNFGVYLKFADSEKIYLISDEVLDGLIIDAESIAASASDEA